MKFSEETQSFYPDDIDYPNLPVDAADIDESQYAALYAAISGGCHVYFYRKKPVCSDPCPDKYHVWDASAKDWIITAEAEQQRKDDETAAAEQKQQALTDEAMQSVSVLQLKLQAGRKLTDAESARLNAVLDYIDSLAAVDLSTAPDISWPGKPE